MNEPSVAALELFEGLGVHGAELLLHLLAHLPVLSDGTHHLLAVVVLLEEFLHIGGGHSGSAGDPLDALSLDEVGLVLLLHGHGVHDDLVLVEPRLRGVEVDLVLHLVHAGQESDQFLEGTHLLDGLHLSVHVVEGEVAGHHVPGDGLHVLFLVSHLLPGDLDEAREVSHSEQTGDEPVGVEGLQVADVLSDSEEHDPRVGGGDGGESASSLSGTVHLGEDDAGDVDRLVEGVSLGSRLLTYLRIEDQDPLLGVCYLGDSDDLFDEVVLQRVASGGIDDPDLLVSELLESVLHDLDCVLLSGLAVDLGTDLGAELLELVESRRPVDVGPDESDAESLLDEVVGELSRGGGLTLTV